MLVLWLRALSRVLRSVSYTHLHHPDEQPVSLGSTQILILGMGHAGAAAYDFLKKRQNLPGPHKVLMVSGIDSDLGKVERHLHEGRRVVYADAEDPGFWHRIKLDGLKAVICLLYTSRCV